MKIVSFGKGTDSTTVLIKMRDLGIVPDLILFADPGGEMPHTIEHGKVMDKWLKDNGFPECTTVVRSGKYETLEQECLIKKILPSPAYGGFKTCSINWKINPQNKYCNNNEHCKEAWANGEKIERYVGFNADEADRRDNARKTDRTDKKYKNVYLLHDELEIDRQGCVDVIKNEGIKHPDKSSCFFCPNMKTHEILDMYLNYPDYFERAVAMEHNAELTKIKGLGRTWSWETLIDTWKVINLMFWEGDVTSQSKEVGLEMTKLIMQTWGSWEDTPPAWKSKITDHQNYEEFLEIMKKAKKLKRNQRREAKADQGTQSGICDFLVDDEDRIACGCYD